VKINFLADASLNQAIVSGVARAEPSIDFLTAAAGRLEGVDDDEVLAIASREGRVVVTHDLKTMLFHFAQVPAIAESRLASEPAESVNRTCWLPV
jgi:predicted nuclease of predicted toxin-antitoxin system